MAFILIVQYDCCSASHYMCLIKLEAEVKNISPSLRDLPENCKSTFPYMGAAENYTWIKLAAREPRESSISLGQ